jgi:hypothetical protein
MGRHSRRHRLAGRHSRPLAWGAGGSKHKSPVGIGVHWQASIETCSWVEGYIQEGLSIRRKFRLDGDTTPRGVRDSSIGFLM